MSRLKKEEYMSNEARQLEKDLKVKIKFDRERAMVRRILANLSDERKQIMLDELSRELASKNNIK